MPRPLQRLFILDNVIATAFGSMTSRGQVNLNALTSVESSRDFASRRLGLGRYCRRIPSPLAAADLGD